MTGLIELPPAMTAREAEGYCPRRWWWALDLEADRLVTLARRHPASERLLIELPPGRYMIGAGPPEVFRREVTVGVDGNVRWRTDGNKLAAGYRAPCLRRGCSGVVVVDGRPMPRCEPDEVPPVERLCANCRGGL